MRLKAFSVSIHLQSSYIAAIGTTPTPNMDRNRTAIVHGFSLVSRHKNNHGIKAKPLFNFNTYNGMMASDYSSYNYDYETIFNIWHCTSSNTIMPLINIDYSPNSQACCQSCQSKIAISEIRVVVMDMSPYQKGDIIRTYYHVNCYSNPYISIIRKQLDDVQNLSKENWMDGERKRSPQKNYVEDFIAIPASTPSRISNTTVTNGAADEGIPTSAEWNAPDSIAMTPENSDPTVITPSRIASPPIVVNPYMREKCLTITGLKYGQVSKEIYKDELYIASLFCWSLVSYWY